MKNRRVAIVHDNLFEYGGSERVVEELLNIYPEAECYTFFFNQSHTEIYRRFHTHQWKTSWLQHIPYLEKLGKYFSILKPVAWWYFSHLDLRNYDLVISSSHSYNAKAVNTDASAVHISYIHTPPRFLYGHSHELSHITKLGVLDNFFRRLRQWDVALAQRPTLMVANSIEVQRRIRRYYGRSSVVVHPPVQMLQQAPRSRHDGYYVLHSRLVKQKGLEFLVNAVTELKLPVKVIGDGYLRAFLEQAAGPQVEFLGFVPDEKLAKIYGGAKALLYAAEEEDFGIVPVEAQSFGVPVIALRSGGVQETVIHGKTGYFFEKKTVAALRRAVRQLEEHPIRSRSCMLHAQQFRPELFARSMKHVVETQTSST